MPSLPSTNPRAWWVLLIIGPILSILLFNSFSTPFGEPPVEDVVYTVKPQYPELTSATLTLVGEWTVSDAGATPTDRKSTLSIELEPGPWQQLSIMTTGSTDLSWNVRISRGYTAQTITGVPAGKPLEIERDQIPEPLNEAPLSLRFTPSQEVPTKALLSRVAIKASARPSGWSIPSVPGALLGGFLPLMLALFFALPGRRTEKQAFLFGGIGGGALVVYTTINSDMLSYLYIAVTGLALGSAAGAYFRSVTEAVKGEGDGGRFFRRLAEGLAIFGIIAWGLGVRWQAYQDVIWSPLLPDATGYMEIAREGSFYVTSQGHAPWIREPLFPALLRGAQWVLPSTAPAMRFFTLLIGLLPLLLIWGVGRKLFSPMVGLLAAGFASVNHFAVSESVELLRDDLLTTLFLLLIAVSVYTGERRWWRAGLFGVVCAALALTRVNMLIFFVPILAIEVYRRRWHPGEIALAVALVVLPCIPHLLYNAQVGGGDFLYSSTVHTSYYLNRAMIGEPGFPVDLVAYHQNPYAGGPVGASALIGNLGLVSMVGMTLRGMVMVFLYEFPHEMLFVGNEVLMLPGLFGAYVLWQKRRDLWWVVLWLLIFMLPVAMVATIHLDRRLALPAMPMILWVWAAGLVFMGEKAKEVLTKKKESTLPSV